MNSEEGNTYKLFLRNIKAYAQAQQAATAYMYMETESAGTNSTNVTGSGEAGESAYAEARCAMTQLSAVLGEAAEPYEGSHVQKTQDQSAATAYNNTSSMEIISAENSASDGPRGPRETANTDPTLQTYKHAAKGFPRKVTWNDPSVTHVGQQSVGASVINLYDVLGRSYRYHLRMKESRAKRAWRSTKRAFSYLFCCCIPERREECLTYIIT